MITKEQAREIASNIGFDVEGKTCQYMQKVDMSAFVGNKKYLFVGNATLSGAQVIDTPFTVTLQYSGVGVAFLTAGCFYYDSVNSRPESQGGESNTYCCAFDDISGEASLLQFQGWAFRK